jgi:plastocyanin
MNFKSVLLYSLLVLAQSASAATVKVSITSAMTFSPDKVQVRVGDTVEFVNESRIPHTVTADPSLAKDPANVILPEGAAPFHSGRIAPGKNFIHQFTVGGLYQYICLPHEGMGMRAQVEVLPAEVVAEY